MIRTILIAIKKIFTRGGIYPNWTDDTDWLGDENETF